MWFNGLHHPFADFFFRYATHLGDGLVLVAFTLVALFWRFRIALGLLVVEVATLLTTGVLKQVVFEGTPRPLRFFESGQLRLVPEVQMHEWNSFPSGHTMAAAALYAFLALTIDKPWAYRLGSALILVVGTSRMYLSQHFFEDVWVGGMLGGIIAYSGYAWSNSWKGSWLDKKVGR